MRLDDPLSNCHTEPGPLGLGRKKGIEDPPSLLCVETGPVIAYRDLDGGLVPKRAYRAANLDAHGIRAGRQRVFKNVPKDLLQSKLINQATEINAAGLFNQCGRSALSRNGQ